MSEDSPPTEEVVKMLLDYLVDPMLPLKPSKKNPPLSDQESVAKQMHAVVLLYNYYHRKLHPESCFLGYEPFCQLALNLKPALIAHMNFEHQGDTTVSRDLGNQLSLTEKAIMDACNICLSLGTLRDVENVEAWPIRKVSVLLIDSKKENCFLLFDSITNGVWSVIEELLDVCDLDSEFSTREGKRTPKDKNDEKGSGFEQVAFSAVENATGIRQSELMVLERHVVYSLSKDKTSACFYIMQCIQSSKDFEVPIKDAIESLQGPLLKWSCGCWMQTQVIEYYNVLPYAMIMSSWYFREFISDNSAGLEISSLEKGYKNCTGKFAESRQAISIASQNYCTGLEDIMDKRSLILKNTCDEELGMSLDFCNRSGNGVKYSTTEAIADDISKLVVKEGEEIEILSESITEESFQKVEKKAQEMIPSDRSFGVSHPALETVANSIDLQYCEEESVSRDDFMLEARESEENTVPGKLLKITQLEGKVLENCNNVACTSKDKIDSVNFEIVEMEIMKTDKSDNSLEIAHPNAGQLESAECFSLEIDTVECNRGKREDERTENSKMLLDFNYLMESKGNNNAGKHLEISQPEEQSVNCNNAPCTGKEKIDLEKIEMAEKEIEKKEISDNSWEITHPNIGQLDIGVCCNLEIDTAERNRGQREDVRTVNSQSLFDSEENNDAENPLEITQPGEQSENCNNVPCTRKEKIDSQNFEMVEMENEKIQKTDDSLHIAHPNAGQLEIGACCNLAFDIVEYNREKEAESAENAKLLGINHSAFKHLGEGTICSDNSKIMEIEFEDREKSNTCPTITQSSELGNSVDENSRGKLASGGDSEKTQKIVEETEQSDDDVKINEKGLGSNNLEDTKQCPSPDLKIIQYPPKKRQKIDEEKFMGLLLSRQKDKNAEVPHCVYHSQKRKTVLESGASSAVGGTGIYVNTAGTPKSLACNFEKENVAENSMDAADCGLVSVIAEKDLELTQTALSFLYNKRAKLRHQKRMIQDEVALCDQNILKILEGKEDALAFKLAAVIEGCKQLLQRGVYSE